MENYLETAQGLYWYCADNHAGQGCPLYAILSTLRYNPGALESGPDNPIAQDVYDSLSGMSAHDGIDAAQCMADVIMEAPKMP